jgi:type IV pilus assembly protein PilX
MNSERLLQPILARAQRGAALITALLLLVVMTILAVTAMQMSRVQERMVGNTRDQNVAFQAAESAVRNGEALVHTQVSEGIAPFDCSAPPPCHFWTEIDAGDVANQSKDWWTANATPFADAAGQPLPGVVANPRYVIVHRGFVRTDGDRAAGVEKVGRDFYEVTGRSTGATGQANAVIQTTFARKF